MKIFDLPTPSFIVNLDILEKNIKDIQKLCDENKKELWPMVKTHKSTEIAKMQMEAGAKGFLVGTIDEAEKLSEKGAKNITFAYPFCGETNIDRIINISEKTHLILSFDNEEVAIEFEEKLSKVNKKMDYLIIVDSGLHRLGVSPYKVVELAEKMKKFKHLKLKGISTHPGQVYASASSVEVSKSVDAEYNTLRKALEELNKNGFEIEIIATGSTPTFFSSVKNKLINVQRPGNYVFYDNIQIGLGIAKEENCSLTVLGTVISNAQNGQLVLDVGSKCLGLDKGAHGISLTSGYGHIKGHEELIIESLSEEVSKVKICGKTDLKVGDKVEIIPNHACSSANMTDYLIGYRNGLVEEILYIDIRGGSRKPPIK